MPAPDPGDGPPLTVEVVGDGAAVPLVLHVPHAGTTVPGPARSALRLDDAELARELRAVTAWHTDVLACRALQHARLAAPVVVNRRSPLVCDPTAGGDGADDYAEAVAGAVDDALDTHGAAVVVGVRSYPRQPLSGEAGSAAPRREICVGTDAEHTPPEVATAVVEACAAIGLDSAVDAPNAGTHVPPRHRGDRRVSAVTVDVRRDTYLEEPGGELALSSERIVGALAGCLADLALLAGRVRDRRAG